MLEERGGGSGFVRRREVESLAGEFENIHAGEAGEVGPRRVPLPEGGNWCQTLLTRVAMD